MICKSGNRMILLLGILSLSLLWAASALAAFVDVGLGARPVGLGRAFVGLADDANAMLYNPAGLARLKSMEFTSMYARLYPGIDDDKLHMGYLGVARPLRNMGTIGLGITNFWADLYGENIFYLSFARQMNDALSLGSNFKLLRWSADGYADPETGQSESGLSWTGWTLDVGLLYELRWEKLMRITGADGWQVGLAVFNLTRPSTAKNGSEDARLPLGFEGGLVYLRGNGKSLISFSRRDDKSRLHLGQEIEIWTHQSRLGPSSFLLRAGTFAMLSDQQGGELDFGFGLTLREALIDYAYVFPLALKEAGGCHKISIGYTF